MTRRHLQRRRSFAADVQPPRLSAHAAHPAEITALIVSYNSESLLFRAVAALEAGTRRPTSIVIVDNASRDGRYLDELERSYARVELIRLSDNTGYCVGNNRGMERVRQGSHVLLLNPDAFVSTSFLERAAAQLDNDPSVGAVGPKLLGANLIDGTPTGRIDSAGIFQTSWGRFYDRCQGERDRGQADDVTADVVALCAAAMLIRSEAISDVTRDGPLFDPRFVMYKEDLDLSFRLRRAGWQTVYNGSIEVLHCRGWNPDRGAMPGWARRRSLINEWRLWRRGWTPERGRTKALPYLVAKSVAVGLGR